MDAVAHEPRKIYYTKVYNFEGSKNYHEYSFDKAVPSGIYPELSIKISDFL